MPANATANGPEPQGMQGIRAVKCCGLVNRWVAGSNPTGEPNFPRLCGLPHSLKNAPGYSGDTGIRAGGPGLEFALGARADQRQFLVVLEAQQRTLLL